MTMAWHELVGEDGVVQYRKYHDDSLNTIHLAITEGVTLNRVLDWGGGVVSNDPLRHQADIIADRLEDVYGVLWASDVVLDLMRANPTWTSDEIVKDVSNNSRAYGLVRI